MESVGGYSKVGGNKKKEDVVELRKHRNNLAVELEEKLKDMARMNKELRRSYDIQSAVNALATFSLKDTSLEEVLDKALDTSEG